MTKKLWYARSRSGQEHIFTTEPERDEKRGIWLGTQVPQITLTIALLMSEGFETPSIGWKDEPVLLELSVKISE